MRSKLEPTHGPARRRRSRAMGGTRSTDPAFDTEFVRWVKENEDARQLRRSARRGMKGMADHRTRSIEFKRQVAQEFLAGETLHGLSKRHDICRNLIRVWVQKYEAGAFNEDVQAADLLQQYEARIAALERLVGKQVVGIRVPKEKGP